MLIGLLAALALAASDDQKAAGAHFDRGVALAARGDYAASISEFEEAYRLAPAWQVLLNIGVVREKLGESPLAIEALEGYLAQGGAAVPTDKRQQVEKELAALRKEVAELVVKVDAEGAAVEVDGQERAATPIYVLPGRHRVTARLDSRSAHADLEVHKGDRAIVALTLPPLAEAPVAVEVPPPAVLMPTPTIVRPAPALVAVTPVPAVEAAKPWYQRWYVWTAIGAVVVAGAVTSVAIVESRPRFDVRIDTP